MPFAVFRRNQRKLLAIFTILAMFGFVVADSLPRLLNGGPSGANNPFIVELYGRSLYASDLFGMKEERGNANQFMSELTTVLIGSPSPFFFGELNTKSLIDAMVLEHKADELGMPGGPDVGRDWLKLVAKADMTPQLFELILGRMNQRVSGEELLTQIGNQVRLLNVRRLFGDPMVTPLDVFETYRDQNERVSVKAIAFRVDDYVKNVAEPTASQVQALYDQYKDELPDLDHPHPGFKIPRQIQAEIMSIDGEALARGLKDRLLEAELLSYYENRKSEFKKPTGFPDEIFAGQPELTPPVVQSFAEVRPYLATSLADERAQSEIVAKFERLKNEVMIPFADKYLDQVDTIAEAKKSGETVSEVLPEPTNLKDLAAKEGLDHEITPLLDADKASLYGAISSAEIGLTPQSGGRKFAEEMFDPKSSLFEPVEFTNFTGRRFLVRKLKDVAPRVPTLDEIRSDVVLAWKIQQARPLAQKAAEALAEALRKDPSKLVGEVIDGKPVITTQPIVKLQPGMLLPGQFGPPTLSEIPEIPLAGDELRDASFGLRPGQIAVAHDEPESRFYVLSLNSRLEAPFAALYAPNSDYFRYRNEAFGDARKKRDEEWMNELRTQAGLKKDWDQSELIKNG